MAGYTGDTRDTGDAIVPQFLCEERSVGIVGTVGTHGTRGGVARDAAPAGCAVVANGTAGRCLTSCNSVFPDHTPPSMVPAPMESPRLRILRCCPELVPALPVPLHEDSPADAQRWEHHIVARVDGRR